MNHICFISLGSNSITPYYMLRARKMLRNEFPDIKFSKLIQTHPINFISNSMFYNQVAFFTSSHNIEDTKKILKNIERVNGRNHNDKKYGIVKLDIDLIVYGNTVLKKDDIKYKHIENGRKELHLKKIG